MQCMRYQKIIHISFLNALSKQMGIEFVWCRLTNIYGPGDYTANLVNYTITKLLKGEETEYSNGDGFCNMIYIDDCVEILALIANEEKLKDIPTLLEEAKLKMLDIL